MEKSQLYENPTKNMLENPKTNRIRPKIRYYDTPSDCKIHQSLEETSSGQTNELNISQTDNNYRVYYVLNYR